MYLKKVFFLSLSSKTLCLTYIILAWRKYPGGGKYQLMSFGGKNMKRRREKGGKCKRKRNKGKGKEKGRKGKENEKRQV
jgi:hypothetical protein